MEFADYVGVLGGIALLLTVQAYWMGRSLGRVEHGLDELRAEMRSEIGGLRGEVGGEIGGLRREFGGEIGSLRGDLAGFRAEVHADLSTLTEHVADLRERVARIEESR